MTRSESGANPEEPLSSRFLEVDRIEVPGKVSYSVYLGPEVLEMRLQELFGDRAVLVVTTPMVFKTYAERLVRASNGILSDGNFLVLDCREDSKNIEQVLKVCERSMDTIDRTGLIVGFGGGVVTDIATFSASIIRRGVAHAKIPTTLIGQIDAAIGIKGGVNFNGKKSYLGCFTAPEEVLVDPVLLQSLPPQHISAGLAEIIKMAVIADAGLFNRLEQYSKILLESAFAKPIDTVNDVLKSAIRLMLSELRPNITETSSLERKVDFGHTFSPVLESALDFSIPHGLAVAIDICFSSAIAVELNRLTEQDFLRILTCIATSGLPIHHDKLTADLCAQALVETSRHRGGKVNLVIPNGIGDATFIRNISDIDETLISKSLSRLRRVCLEFDAVS